MSTMSKQDRLPQNPRVSRRNLQETLSGYAFILPAVLGLLIFTFVPLIFAFWASLYELPLPRPDLRTFIGFENYRLLFRDPLFWKSLRNTLLYAVIQMPAQTILGLLLALLIQRGIRGVSIFRTIFYLPVVISMVVASLLWRIILDSDSGLLNAVLAAVNIAKQPLLNSASQALPSIAGMLTWKWVGISMIIFLAGLQGIPEEYYEAAKIDGANSLKRFLHITLPLLKRPALFVVVTNTLSSLRLFTPVWIITEGGPEDSTSVLIFYIVRNAFRYYRMGFASAGAIVMLFLLIVVTAIQFRIMRVRAEE